MNQRSWRACFFSMMTCCVGLAASPALGQGCNPLITANPQSASTCHTTAVFSVGATSDTPMTFGWQVETAPDVWQGMANDPFPMPCEGGFAFASLPFASTTPIGIHPCAGVYRYQVRASVTNSCGTTYSDSATFIISSADFDGDGDSGTDADIEAFFACIAGNCCATCGSADFNGDGDTATDADIESFFRVLAGGSC